MVQQCFHNGNQSSMAAMSYIETIKAVQYAMQQHFDYGNQAGAPDTTIFCSFKKIVKGKFSANQNPNFYKDFHACVVTNPNSQYTDIIKTYYNFSRPTMIPSFETYSLGNAGLISSKATS